LERLHRVELIERLEEAKRKGVYLAKGQYATDKYCFKVPKEQVNEIREELSVLLTVKGLEIDGELNAIGFLIENLIDIFESET